MRRNRRCEIDFYLALFDLGRSALTTRAKDCAWHWKVALAEVSSTLPPRPNFHKSIRKNNSSQVMRRCRGLAPETIRGGSRGSEICINLEICR
jgi:hypothetical protein